VAILGGAAFARAGPEDTARGFALALERGVNHLDVAPTYGDAERALGAHVAEARARLFVACKTRRRAPDGVRAQLEESLARLRTDHFDLYQLHAVTDLTVLEERAGAAEVALRARDEGLTRFVGITGHDLGAPRAQLEALRRWDLDTVMFAVYPRVWADPAYRDDAEALLAECAARDVGVMAIKAVARRPWADRDRFATTWYEPVTEPGAIAGGVAFALSTPGVHAFCTPGDLELLPAVLDAAAAVESLSAADRDRAAAVHADEELIFPLAEKAAR
jgi:aryl-alcohol dehydrogenase-like predicted oxidoreductase